MMIGVSALLLVLTPQGLLFGNGKTSKADPRLVITECAEDGFEVWIPYSATRDKIAQVGDVDIDAGFPDNRGANVWFVRGGKEIFNTTIEDLNSGSVWIAVAVNPVRTPTQARVAITYSDGGAAGGFHVRVFLIDGNNVSDASKSIDAAVADFRARHYCETRGNNVTALKWIRDNLLLLNEVYPTSDCGPDAGHEEGYLVSVPAGKVLDHMAVNQLKHYPGVCLENYNEN